ncbi:MAG: hypothetical protein CL565_06565 [Alphaproteobacteria bacterium]|nr:hypothetical protein [Alphaproteobacteria bacterium]|tara:strand:+ start:282 stop:1181 length:900 start_codon:yes stop_codon:yes gene_type:complete
MELVMNNKLSLRKKLAAFFLPVALISSSDTLNVPDSPLHQDFLHKFTDNKATSDEVLYLDILSMNVRGLGIFSGGKNLRSERFHELRKIGSQYDMIFMQEAFSGTNAIHDRNKHAYDYHPGFGHTILQTPGLRTFSSLPFKDTEAKAYKSCSGYFTKRSDCLASKGYQKVTVGRVNIINTHLDAGKDPKDSQARSDQLSELESTFTDNQPVILLGDLNIHEIDENELEAFMKRKSLKIIIRNRVDIILTNIPDLAVIDSKIIPLKKHRLSDHDGLSLRISLPRDYLKPAVQGYTSASPS